MLMSQVYICSRTWDNKPTAFEYRLKLCIVSGDLQVMVDAPFFDDERPHDSDADAQSSSGHTRSLLAAEGYDDGGMRHELLGQYECVSIILASGIEDVEPQECEYVSVCTSFFLVCSTSVCMSLTLHTQANPSLSPPNNHRYIEIMLGPHGHYLMTGFSGAGDDSTVDTGMVFESPPETKIDLVKGRWSCKASIPFFYLPAPGDDPRDPLSLIWALNYCGMHDKNSEKDGRQYLSLVHLPGSGPNLHQLHHFAPLVLSDAASQRLRSISRASVSMKSIAQDALALNDSASGFTPDVLKKDLLARGVTSAGDDEDDGGEGANESVDSILTRFMAAHDSETKDLLIQLFPEEKHLKILFSQNLQKNEKIVMIGKYWKRKGWSHKRCILMLTTLGKLMYFDSTAPYTFRGSIVWKMTRPVRVLKLSDVRFDVELADCSRTYHFYDEEGTGTDKWVQVITQVNSSRRTYMRESLGVYDADVIEAVERRKRDIKRRKGNCNIL